jgi:hypothetical protein
VLESAGRLFKRSVKMYVYPTRDAASNEIRTVLQAPIPAPWNHLRDLLLEIGRIVPIHVHDESLLSIHTPEVLERIQRQDPTWEAMVPAVVAEAFKTKNLFGLKSNS